VKTTKQRDTRIELEKFVPRETWGELYNLFITFGTDICTLT